MRGFTPDYIFHTPATFAETLALLSASPKGQWKVFAGGTDLMVTLEAGQLKHTHYLNLAPFSDTLRGITADERYVTLGALCTYSDVLANETMQREFPMVCSAAGLTGAHAIQNRGTLGGNIANASPAADTPPALLCYDAQLELTSASGIRSLPYSAFHTGYKKTLMEPDELITKIRLPRPLTNQPNQGNETFELYRKVGTRKAQAISKVCFAGSVRIQKGHIVCARVALGSVAPMPLRASRTEHLLVGKPFNDALIGLAVESLAQEIAPIDDVRSNRLFRLTVAQQLLEDFLKQAKKHVGLDL